MDIPTFGTFLGGIGVGSLLTAVVTEYLAFLREKRQRRHKTKLESYENFIDAYGKAIITEGKPIEFAAAYTKLTIVASPEVIAEVTQMLKTKANTSEKVQAFNRLYAAMRKDIAVDKERVEWDTDLNTPGQFR